MKKCCKFIRNGYNELHNTWSLYYFDLLNDGYVTVDNITNNGLSEFICRHQEVDNIQILSAYNHSKRG